MAKTKQKTTGLRRVPTQDRSRRRLESILDAAAVLFADQGFEGTTIDAIASAAETSVGSLYQFFPNKLAVLRGVSDRCHERVRIAFGALIGPDPAARDLGDLIDVVVDGFVALQEQDASFRAVWVNTQQWREFEEEELMLEEELVAGTCRLFELIAPNMSEERRPHAALVMVQTVSAGLFLILRDENVPRKPLIRELKAMLRAYAAALVRDSEG